jgi:hypothetical protein
VVLIVPLALSHRPPTDASQIRELKRRSSTLMADCLAQVEVIVSQKILLTNPKTGAAEQSRVVRSEQTNSPDLCVAIQFEQPAPTASA